MDQRILLISISSAFLLWFLWHFGRALWIVWINARVRRHGVPIKGRVVSATDKTYKTRDGAIFFFRVTYTYIYEGLRFYAEQDVSEDAPIPIFHYDKDIDILLLPRKPRISRIATCKYVWKYRLVVGGIALFFALIFFGIACSTPN